MTPESYIKTFEYRRGIPFIYGWQITRKGVCTDFALTMLYIVEGESLLRTLWALITLKAAIWLVKSPSNGLLPRHAALWHREYGWIDSTVTVWRTSPSPHSRVFPHLLPWVLFRMVWGLFARPFS